MVGFLLVFVAFATLVALAVNPKLGAILVWPIIYLYPHLYMLRLEMLPWNIGVDDLFICCFFLIVVVRRNLFDGVPFRFGLSVVGALAYFAIWTVANLSGWTIMPELEPFEAVKPILKCFIFVLFTYSMVHCIDNERDLRRVAVAFVVTLAIAGVTVILHQVFPQQMVIFTNVKVERFQRWYGQIPRAVGSLMNPNTGCVILGMAAVFASRLTRLAPSLVAKTSLIAGIVMMLVGMVLTESRTGALALGMVLLCMMALSSARMYAGAMVAATLLMVALSPVLFQDYFARFAEALNTVGDPRLGAGVQSRLDTWLQYARDATAQTLLLGQGQLVPTRQIGFHAHSSYVSALFMHGIGGVFWFVSFFGVFAWRGIVVVRASVEPYATLASAILWGSLLFAIAGLMLDLLVDFNTRFIYLFYAVMIERCHTLVNLQGTAGFTQFLDPHTPTPSAMRRPPDQPHHRLLFENHTCVNETG